MPRLYFVRHGEALHNPFIVRGKRDNDEAVLREGRSILNPSLTEVGQEQARALARKLEADGMHFDLLVTTPLARTIETSHMAFGKCCDKFVLTPEATETAEERLGGPQRGWSVSETRAKYPFLESWDLSAIKEGSNWVLGDESVLGGAGWFNPTPIGERLGPLKAWLQALPHDRVVVVGHSGVFDKLLGLQMGNCELVEHAFDTAEGTAG